MIIQCNTHDELMDCILDCVKRGLTFHADYTNRTIRLEGGY